MEDLKPRLSWRRSIIPLSLLAIGCILAAIQILYNAGSYLQSILVPTEHPATYRFTGFDQLMRAHVKGELVDYQAIRKESARLKLAVDELKHISPDRLESPTEELCFWINAYNLLVIEDIMEHYPVQNAKGLSDIFSVHNFVVGGKPYSVERIEQLEIRPRIARGDARALFTVCGGARGYPPLTDHALDPIHFEDDVSLACTRFVCNSNNVFLDPDTDTLFLSPFFKWNDDLLSRDFGSPFDFANAQLPPDQRIDLRNIHIKKAYTTSFNWWLNDTALGPIQRRRPSGAEPENPSDGAPDAPSNQTNR